MNRFMKTLLFLIALATPLHLAAQVNDTLRVDRPVTYSLTLIPVPDTVVQTVTVTDTVFAPSASTDTLVVIWNHCVKETHRWFRPTVVEDVNCGELGIEQESLEQALTICLTDGTLPVNEHPELEDLLSSSAILAAICGQPSDNPGGGSGGTENPNTPDPLVITTTSLPSVQTGVAYNQTLVATGGAGAYVWDLLSGSLTGSGLTLNSNGTVTGTASAAATYNFTARVTDGDGTTQTQGYSILVSAAPATTALMDEDWNYANLTAIFNVDGVGGKMYGTNINIDDLSYGDVTVASGLTTPWGGSHAIDLQFNPQPASSQPQLGIFPRLYRMPGFVQSKEIWIEQWVRFDPYPTWRTQWGGPVGAPAHKWMFVWANDGQRYDILIGQQDGTEIQVERVNQYFEKSFIPPAGKFNAAIYNARDQAGDAYDTTTDGIWDGEWHRTRIYLRHESSAGAADGAWKFWIDDLAVTDSDANNSGPGVHMNSPNGAYWDALSLGANLNHGPQAEMSFQWGRTRVWLSDPEWTFGG